MQSATPSKKVGVALCFAVILAAAILFLLNLGEKPFWDYDEAIYANVIHDTVQSGNNVTPHLAGEPWFEKPPLLFWLSMAADDIFHQPEFSYRLTAALAGIISIGLTMLITYEVSGNLLVAALAGLILLTTGTFLEAGREVRTDIPAIAMVLLSVYSFVRGLRSPMWFIGIGLGLALGVLFKSVIGLLSLPFLLFWLFYNRDVRWLRSRYVWMSTALFFLIVSPWYVYESSQYGQSFWNASLGENLTHFSKSILKQSYSSNDYINYFLTYAAPWSDLFVLLVIWLGVNSKQYRSLRMRDIFAFASTALFLFLFFLFASTKILTYLLPVYPFVAIALALAIGYLAEQFVKKQYVIRSGFMLLCILCAFGVWVTYNFGFHIFPYVAVNDLIASEETAAAEIIAQQPKQLDVYSYQYDYYDTIEYYSGRRAIKGMTDDQVLDEPFLLLVAKPYMDWHKFPNELQAHLATLYQGQTLILYEFKP